MDDIDPDAALALADKLYNGAHESRVHLEWLSSDLRYYLASRAMMDKYRCNAFSTACVELPLTHPAEQEVRSVYHA